MAQRWKLQNACLEAGLTLQDLADDLRVDVGTVSRWMDGSFSPSPQFIPQLLKRFNAKRVYDLDLQAEFSHAPTHRGEDKVLTMLEHYNRRQLLAVMSKLSVFAGIDMAALEAVFDGKLVAPDDLLYMGKVIIDQCWNLLEDGNYFVADNLLIPLISKLDPIATRASKLQNEAASLALEATIIRMCTANHTMNYKRRVSLGEDAIKYGEMSGDNNALIMALGWHGNTFTSCFNQPEKAFLILSKAVPLFDSTSPLNQADISMNIAMSYALQGNETMARDYAVQARQALPDDPMNDLLYRIIDLGTSELHQRVGKMYLILAKKFPSQKAEYGQLAYDAVVESVNHTAVSNYQLCGRLITKAEVASLVGNMDDHFNSLREGANMAFQVDSEKQKTKAIYVLNNTPRKWRTDARYSEIRTLLLPPQTTH